MSHRPDPLLRGRHPVEILGRVSSVGVASMFGCFVSFLTEIDQEST